MVNTGTGRRSTGVRVSPSRRDRLSTLGTRAARLRRSGHLLRPVRVPHHEPAPVRAGRFGHHPTGRLLGPPGPAPAPGALTVGVRARRSTRGRWGPVWRALATALPRCRHPLYFANWQQVVAGHSYFAQYQRSTRSCTRGRWRSKSSTTSCGRLLFVGLVYLGRRRSRRALVIGTALLATASALWMGVAAHVLGPNRAYLGTDTRMWELLWVDSAPWRCKSAAPTRRPAWWSAATVLAVGGVALASRSVRPPRVDVDGGLVAIAACALVVVVGSVRHPGGPVGATARPGGRCAGSVESATRSTSGTGPSSCCSPPPTRGCGSRPPQLRLATMTGAACVQLVRRRAAPAARPTGAGRWRRALVRPASSRSWGWCSSPRSRRSRRPPRGSNCPRRHVRPGSAATITLPAGRVVTPADPLRALDRR